MLFYTSVQALGDTYSFNLPENIAEEGPDVAPYRLQGHLYVEQGSPICFQSRVGDYVRLAEALANQYTQMCKIGRGTTAARSFLLSH